MLIQGILVQILPTFMIMDTRAKHLQKTIFYRLILIILKSVYA